MTLSRIPLSFLFGYFCIKLEQPLWPCLIVFLLVSLTDWLDGKLARTLRATSALGAWLDVSCDLFFYDRILSVALAHRQNADDPANRYHHKIY